MISETQSKSLDILKSYNVNINQFIRTAIKDKILCDWKMPVVEKIHEMEVCVLINFLIPTLGTKYFVSMLNTGIKCDIITDGNTSMIETTWIAVVEFVKWYNNKK